MGRVAQFFREIIAIVPLRPSQADWVKTHLSEQEQHLFARMANRDQHHAVRVSRRLDAIARDHGLSEYDRRVLIRAGLLHDIGRAQGDVGLIDKVLYVVMRRVFPRLSARLAELGRMDELRQRAAPLWLARIGHAFSTQQEHPVIGAQLAKLHGVESEVEYLIRNHHNDHDGDKLLKLFAIADR